MVGIESASLDANLPFVPGRIGVRHPLEMPEGRDGVITVAGKLDLAACASGQITIDFDAKHSCKLAHREGTSGIDEKRNRKK